MVIIIIMLIYICIQGNLISTKSTTINKDLERSTISLMKTVDNQTKH